MNRIYLDNAATTPLDPEVLEAMLPCFQEHFGNPSSIHAFGRRTRAAVEQARRQIALLLNCTPGEIIFTSGGTEADNMALSCSVRDLGVRHIITSPIEHHAVELTAEAIGHQGGAQVHWLRLHADGQPDLVHLEELLQATNGQGVLVSLMHANNEIGTRIDLKVIGELAHRFGALFHSDTVQTMGHYAIDVNEIGIDLLTSSAHKFNGPKGVGFLYIRQPLKPGSMITGGGQERNSRAGTENLPGIAGMAEALNICYEEMEGQHQHMQALKSYAIQLLSEKIPDIKFNGNTAPERSLYTVLSLSIPPTPLKEMLLFRLDIEGVCVSGGSACNSGAQKGSHVLMALNHPEDRMGIRMSFGKANTMEDIEFAVDKLTEILGAN